MIDKFDIVIAGVGGQGTILASKLIGRAAILSGLAVRGSELLGLSQRGGAVTSHVRIGRLAESPLIMEGSADLLLGFEPAEALRQLPYLARSGVIVSNRRPTIPNMVSMGQSKYPSLDEVLRIFRGHARTLMFDATGLALKAGSPLALNAVMLGAMVGTGVTPIEASTMLKAIEAVVKPATLVFNRLGFQLGLEEASRAFESLPVSVEVDT